MARPKPSPNCAHRVEYLWLLKLGRDLLASLLSSNIGSSVQLKELVYVELGRFEDLDFANVNVLQRVDALGRLLDLAANHLGDELVNELLQVARTVARESEVMNDDSSTPPD